MCGPSDTSPTRKVGFGIEAPHRNNGQFRICGNRLCLGADQGDAVKPEPLKRSKQGNGVFVGVLRPSKFRANHPLNIPVSFRATDKTMPDIAWDAMWETCTR
jgi:hypothetical protein